MKDITTFCLKTDIKPQLQKVYVYEKDGKKFAVATDTFRLVEWEIKDDFLKEYITPMYYDQKLWKEMCKAYNKKNRDIRAFSNALRSNEVINKNFDYQYPDYLILLENETKDFDNSVKVNQEYLFDFLNLVPKNKYNTLDFSEIKLTDKMIVYKDNDIKLILMQILD